MSPGDAESSFRHNVDIGLGESSAAVEKVERSLLVLLRFGSEILSSQLLLRLQDCHDSGKEDSANSNEQDPYGKEATRRN